jgi:GNAT superfamily N-acetyltransferase
MPDIQLRRFTLDDLPRAFDLSTSAGSKVTPAYWTRIMRLAGESCYCLADGDLFVSSAVCVPYGRERGWIALVFTRPEYRGHGLATQVTQAALDDLKARVKHVFLDASPMGRPIYERMGFTPLFTIDVYEGQANAPQASGIRLLEPDDVEAVIHLDTDSFGAARPAVIRQFVEEFPGRSWVDESSGEISGYALGRVTRGGYQIGPMMHRSAEGAERLLQTALHALQGSAVRLDMPTPNAAAIQLAQKYGLNTLNHSTRMIYGPVPPDLYFGERQYATGSPSTG